MSQKVIAPKDQAYEIIAQSVGLSKAYLSAPKALTPYFDDPVAFIHDMFDWRHLRNGQEEQPLDYQEDIAAILAEKHREAAYGPRGLGKSAVDSWLVLWFALTRDSAEIDWKLGITAGTWNILTNYLWPEIRKWARRLRWDRLRRIPFDKHSEMLSLNLKLRFGEVFSFSPKDPALAEGAHATQIMLLFDESKSIAAELFDSCEGAFSGAELGGDNAAYVLATSSPGPPIGRFFDICSFNEHYQDWVVRPVTLEECLRGRRIAQKTVDERLAQWGPDSPMFQSQILGHFAAEDTNGVIPFYWVQEANERWKAWWSETRESAMIQGLPVDAIGVDVASELGGDNTVFGLRWGDILTELRRYPRADTMEAVGYLVGLLEKHEHAKAVVDVVGIGTGPFDRLKELGYVSEDRSRSRVIAFNAGAAPKTSRGVEIMDLSGELHFLNKRAAAWWGMRERLDPARDSQVMLPPDPKLIGDLTAPTYRQTSAGKIQVEDKEHIASRIHRSTDDGDACIQAFWDEPPEVAAAAASVDPPSVMGPERRSKVW